MKRFIIMLCLFTVVLLLGFVEIGFTTKIFTETHEKLEEIEKSMILNVENLDNAETKALIDKTLAEWKKGKGLAMIATNHAVVRTAEEKFVSLQNFIHLNEKSDAFNSLALAKTYIHELINDNYPILSNIL